MKKRTGKHTFGKVETFKIERMMIYSLQSMFDDQI